MSVHSVDSVSHRISHPTHPFDLAVGFGSFELGDFLAESADLGHNFGRLLPSPAGNEVRV